MSELDTDLRGLRDELTAVIPIPDVDRVTGRARARQRTQLGAIVAVLVVALAVPVLRALPFGKEAAAPPQSTSYLVDFADPDHGYALARSCAKGNEDCRYTLYRTADGAKTWQPRQLPRPDNGASYFAATLYVLGPDAVAIDRPVGDKADRIYSNDSGRTWNEATSARPAGSSLNVGELVVGACGAKPHLSQGCTDIGVIDPDSGAFVPVPEQPPLTGISVGSVVTSGGSWWAGGTSLSTHNGAVAVSRDGGKTWLSGDLGEVVPLAVVERDGVLYAIGFAHSVETSGLGVWRSDNGGRAWTLTGVTDKLNDVVGSPVAASDGSLTVSDGTSVYVSTNEGGSFKRVGDAVGAVKWTRAGYLRMNVDKFALSTDGLHWREFTIG